MGDINYLRDIREFIVVLRQEARSAQCADEPETIAFVLSSIFGASGPERLVVMPDMWKNTWELNKEKFATKEGVATVDVAHEVFAKLGFQSLTDKYTEAEALRAETVHRARKGESLQHIFEGVMATSLLHGKREAFPIIAGKLWLTEQYKGAIQELLARAGQDPIATEETKERWKTRDPRSNPMGWELTNEDTVVMEHLFKDATVSSVHMYLHHRFLHYQAMGRPQPMSHRGETLRRQGTNEVLGDTPPLRQQMPIMYHQ